PARRQPGRQWVRSRAFFTPGQGTCRCRDVSPLLASYHRRPVRARPHGAMSCRGAVKKEPLTSGTTESVTSCAFSKTECASPETLFPPRLHVLLQPREHLLVPVLAVLRLQHPVPLVGEVDHPARHAQPLQRREQLVPLPDRAAEVQV